jgi:hypothetical protein
MSKSKRLGELEPRYNFFLNPYPEFRFTRCPQGEKKTRQRKLPLFIHVDPMFPLILNKTCRYCPDCDLLIAHQDELEGLLTSIFSQRSPEMIGTDYLVLGTVERDFWKQGTRQAQDIQAMEQKLHEFKQHLEFEIRYGWMPDEEKRKLGKKDSPQRQQSNAVSTPPSPGKTDVDDLLAAMCLVEKMQAHLPFLVRPSRELIRTLRGSSVRLDGYQDLKVEKVFYLGDEGGIMCSFYLPGRKGEVTVCSLTRLVLKPDQPLYQEMRAYQEERERKLLG